MCASTWSHLTPSAALSVDPCHDPTVPGPSVPRREIQAPQTKRTHPNSTGGTVLKPGHPLFLSLCVCARCYHTVGTEEDRMWLEKINTRQSTE
uniref:Uncharacterized protein n=1 Tax=Knipowitschia caucasica TaxID=637954 RepID=A0AAV2M3Q2_KNICA